MIWIDVTELKNWRGHHTGIQRVISKIGEQLIKVEGGYRTCYFEHATGTFREYPYSFSEEIDYSSTSTGNKYSKMLSTKINRAQQIIIHRTPPKVKNNVKKAGQMSAFFTKRHPPAKLKKGDVLFLPGAFWVYPESDLERIKKDFEIKIAGVMYDLVPMVVPQFTALGTVEAFTVHFKNAIPVFDWWFAISQNTKNDMLIEAEKYNLKLNPKTVSVIKLGVESKNEKLSITRPTELPHGVTKYALFVSTIEARKNQTLVYQAVKRLTEKGEGHIPIVLVGKYGWLCDDLVYILKNDYQIKDKIIWLRQVDDKGLRWLYDNCEFTIYPSYYEGWGLPVAESLAFDKPVIASNSSSIPEVAGDAIEYFSPFSGDELASLLVKYSDGLYLKKRKAIIQDRYKTVSWSESAETVKDALEAL